MRDFSVHLPLPEAVPISEDWSGGTSLFPRKGKSDLGSEVVGKVYRQDFRSLRGHLSSAQENVWAAFEFLLEILLSLCLFLSCFQIHFI